MLTSGEFVINRDATRKYRPLLERINGDRRNDNRAVQYRQDGGMINAVSGKNLSMVFDTSGLGGVFDSFNGSTNILKDAFDTFGQHAIALENYTTALSKLHIPDRIEMQGTHTVNLNVNGLSVLNGLQDIVRDIVVSEINRATGGYNLNSNSGIPSGRF